MQRTYIDAFGGLEQRWAPPRPPREHRSTVKEILENFHAMDRELIQTLEAFSDDDWDVVTTRPDGTTRSQRRQLEIYSQFMLIFLGKVTVYARAQNRDLPPSLKAFVG